MLHCLYVEPKGRWDGIDVFSNELLQDGCLASIIQTTERVKKNLNYGTINTIVKHWDTWTIFKEENAYQLTLEYVYYTNSSNNGSSNRSWVIHEDKTVAEQSEVLIHHMVIDSFT